MSFVSTVIFLLLMDQLHEMPYDAMLFLKCLNIFSLPFISSKLENDGNMVMLARPKIGYEQGIRDRLVTGVILSLLFICSIETFGFVSLFKNFLEVRRGHSNAVFVGKKPHKLRW